MPFDPAEIYVSDATLNRIRKSGSDILESAKFPFSVSVSAKETPRFTRVKLYLTPAQIAIAKSSKDKPKSIKMSKKQLMANLSEGQEGGFLPFLAPILGAIIAGATTAAAAAAPVVTAAAPIIATGVLGGASTAAGAALVNEAVSASKRQSGSGVVDSLEEGVLKHVAIIAANNGLFAHNPYDENMRGGALMGYQGGGALFPYYGPIAQQGAGIGDTLESIGKKFGISGESVAKILAIGLPVAGTVAGGLYAGNQLVQQSQRANVNAWRPLEYAQQPMRPFEYGPGFSPSFVPGSTGYAPLSAQMQE